MTEPVSTVGREEGEPEPRPVAEPDEFEVWGRRRRTERKFLRGILLLLLLSSMYVAFLDGRRLVNELPRPYTLTFSRPSGGANARYAASVLWKGETRVRPDIMMDGKVIPSNPASRADGFALSLHDNAHQVTVDLPPGVAGGVHEGVLRFEKLAREEDKPRPDKLPEDNLPSTLESPLRIDVLDGFWENWRFLRSWLAVVVGLMIALYIFCIIQFPRPSGDLVVSKTEEDTLPKFVRLSMTRWAHLFPWRRSLLYFPDLLKRASVPQHLAVPGELEFIVRGKPFLFVYPGPRQKLVRKGTVPPDGDVSDLDEESFTAIGAINVIDEQKVYRIGAGQDPGTIIVRYRKPRR